MKEKKHLTVGKILSAWGVRGQIKVEPLTDNPKRFETLHEIFIYFDGQAVSYQVESVMFLKHYFPVLKLVGINSRQGAETLKGHYINIQRKYAVRLPKGRCFICDIIGLRVFNEYDEYIGTVTDVLKTGANDVYVVEANNANDILIPAIKQVVKKIDLDNGIMVIRPLEGML
ncbi:MAG TPA: 16S rRNA processing protein RimM [Thermoanaerobacterales bacterium]|nr:16S rRNA processing protein RimM [Thermoanaerobacterales bacterium]